MDEDVGLVARTYKSATWSRVSAVDKLQQLSPLAPPQVQHETIRRESMLHLCLHDREGGGSQRGRKEGGRKEGGRKEGGSQRGRKEGGREIGRRGDEGGQGRDGGNKKRSGAVGEGIAGSESRGSYLHRLAAEADLFRQLQHSQHVC